MHPVLFQYIRVESHTVATAHAGVVKGWLWVDYYDQVGGGTRIRR